MHEREAVKRLVPIVALAFVSVAQAQGDPSAGAAVYAQCAACHAVGAGAQSNVGPALNGIVGRRAATYPGFRYSSALRKSGLTWDDATLAQYLRAPDKVVPGTKMVFAGIANEKDLADVIAYLKQQTAK
jgi:cytochrome c